MTYARFHLIFNLPVLLFLGWIQRHSSWSFHELVLLGALLLVILLFTSPWDNHAVRMGIWDFPLGRYAFRIGLLPIEEYLFFWLQSLNVILSLRLWLQTHPDLLCHAETPLHPIQGLLILALLGLWILVGYSLHRHPPAARWNYTRHLFFWFTPVILLQWILAPSLFAHHRNNLFLMAFGWGLYYTLGDWVATKSGIWFFDEKQITGNKLFRVLPWEEIAFFILTSLLVAQSYLLLLPAAMR